MSVKGRQTMDHERVCFNLAKLKKGGINFEIAVEPDLAIDMKKGKEIDIKDVVKSDNIFSDVKKGLLAPEKEMDNLFRTTNTLEIAKIIIKDGEIQLTEEYRSKVRAEKRKKIIEIIRRNGVDPRTKLPHPPQRIENALNEAKVKIDEFKTAEDQVDDVLNRLKAILPISFEKKRIALKIPPEFAAKSYSVISQFAKPEKEEWQNDGSYVCSVEIPAGLEPDFYDKLNTFTKGNVETRVVK